VADIRKEEKMAGQVSAYGRRFRWLGALVSCAALAIPSGAVAAGQDSPDSVLAALQKELGAREKKYAALVKKVDREVERVLAEPVAEGSRPLAEHPWIRTVARLAEAAREKPDLRAETRALIARYPWTERLELAEGVEFGSDRAVPDHDNGFIALGRAAERGCDPLPTFVNTYLFGLQEIVGWDYGVEASRKSLRRRPRAPKQAAEHVTELPPWEALRTWLTGSLPDVPLLAIPRLQHEIHARLAERRAQAGGTATRMDEVLAFLDSRWNGFTYEVPYTDERIAIALPVFALMADRSQLVYRSPLGERLADSGDIPFVSVLTLQAHAHLFRGETVEPRDFIARTARGNAEMEAFNADCKYLVRYRALIDLFVYTLLAPDLPLPGYLAYLDYPEGRIPRTRENSAALDVPRAHALLVWALCEKDPVRLADWLYDELLSEDENRFPADVALPVALTLLVREREHALLEEVARTLRAARDAGRPDLELEFAPWADRQTSSGDLATPYLVDSYHSSAALVADGIRAAASAIVAKELR
jgi:hypothetical protein